jgi:hypothetical protein
MFILLALFALGLVACAGPRALVDYHRSGGIVGFDDRLTIDVNGNDQFLTPF